MSVNVIKAFCCFLTIQTVCQPVLRRAAQECPVRTSLDLELDLQASLTRQSRLNDELQALRGLRQKLEELKAQGETDLPPGVREDERFQKLLKEAEKQVQVSVSPLSLRDYIEPGFIKVCHVEVTHFTTQFCSCLYILFQELGTHFFPIVRDIF